MSEWFFGTPIETRQRLVPVRVRWTCPKCAHGEMVFNGYTWPTGDPGYHHTCTACKHTAAINCHRYPEIRYEDADGNDEGAQR